MESSFCVDAKATGSTRVAQLTLVYISASVVGIASITGWTGTGIITGRVLANGLVTACLWVFAFIDIGAS